MHGSSAAVAGEFAIVPPFLGSSQRLLNRDHYSVYYKVRGRHMPYPGMCQARELHD